MFSDCRYLYSILQKSSNATDYNSEQIVESLRLFSEILVWGDQNDGNIMEYVSIICFPIMLSIQQFFLGTECSRASHWLRSEK